MHSAWEADEEAEDAEVEEVFAGVEIRALSMAVRNVPLTAATTVALQGTGLLLHQIVIDQRLQQVLSQVREVVHRQALCPARVVVVQEIKEVHQPEQCPVRAAVVHQETDQVKVVALPPERFQVREAVALQQEPDPVEEEVILRVKAVVLHRAASQARAAALQVAQAARAVEVKAV